MDINNFFLPDIKSFGYETANDFLNMNEEEKSSYAFFSGKKTDHLFINLILKNMRCSKKTPLNYLQNTTKNKILCNENLLSDKNIMTQELIKEEIPASSENITLCYKNVIIISTKNEFKPPKTAYYFKK